MRRNYLVLLALPAASALSLANFQSISLTTIPLICQLTYDGQIPSCLVSDFNTGCTPACVAGLNSIAADVISACDGVHVTSNSLLGIIQNGGIQGALCPTLAKVTTTTKLKTTSAVPATTPAVVSVTLPTDSIGVTGGLGFKTSSTATVKSTSVIRTLTTKSSSKNAESTSTSASSVALGTSSSVESAATEIPPATATSITIATTARGSVQTSSSTTAAATTKAQTNTGVSGGGSPFDIQSGASRLEGTSGLGLFILAAWAGFIVGR